MSEEIVATPSAEGISTATPATEPVATPPPPAEDPKFAAKFAALSRQEKAVREAKAEVERRDAEIKAKLEAEAAWQKQFDEDPIAALEAKGIKWDKVQDRTVNPKSEIEKLNEELRKEIETLKSALTEDQKIRKEKEEAATKAEYDSKMNAFRSSLKNTLNSGSFPFATTFADAEVVEQLIIHKHATEGIILKNEEACKLVDEFYAEKYKALKAKETPAPTPPVSDDSKQPPASEAKDATKPEKRIPSGTVKGPPPTLGNKGTPVPPVKTFDEMDSDEKKEFLAQKLKMSKGKK